MPDWVKQNIPVVVLFVIGIYVGLQTLEVKFSYQETRAQERYRIMISIEEALKVNTQELTKLQSNYNGLNARVSVIETYIPRSITDLEKEVMILGYKVENSDKEKE
jgi:dimeric dUTPase (all-alpha-NTP-PPase superfamily)